MGEEALYVSGTYPGECLTYGLHQRLTEKLCTCGLKRKGPDKTGSGGTRTRTGDTMIFSGVVCVHGCFWLYRNRLI